MALNTFWAVAFIAMGIGFASAHPGDLWMQLVGGALAAGFAFVFALCLAEIVRPRIGLHLDVEGVHSRQALGGNAFDLPWSQLAGVRVVTLSRQSILAFDAVDADWGLVDVKPTVRAMRLANRALVGSWMSVPAQPFGIEPEALIAEIDRYRRALTPGAPVVYPRPV